MRIMAVDYGDVRTGLAVSDETATLAGEAWVIKEKNEKEAARTIAAQAVSRGVSCIVVGYPKNMNGTIGPRGEKSERLAELLRTRFNTAANVDRPSQGAAADADRPSRDAAADADKPSGINVVLWDERLTTISANRILTETGKRGQKRKKAVDAIAASLILESYLNSRLNA